jgi:hypothetical protein
MKPHTWYPNFTPRGWVTGDCFFLATQGRRLKRTSGSSRSCCCFRPLAAYRRFRWIDCKSHFRADRPPVQASLMRPQATGSQSCLRRDDTASPPYARASLSTQPLLPELFVEPVALEFYSNRREMSPATGPNPRREPTANGCTVRHCHPKFGGSRVPEAL